MKKLMAFLRRVFGARREQTLDEVDQLLDRELLREPMIPDLPWDEVEAINLELAALANREGR